MNGAEIKKTLKANGVVCGSLVVSPSPKWAKYIRQTGIDFVFIDTEHVMIDSMTLSWMCMTYSAMGLAPIVRLPSADPARATAVLDGGAQGVLVPYMESPSLLKQMVGAVHYKPVKGAKLEKMLNGTEPFPDSLIQELAEKNRNNMLFINIESLSAVDRLDELLSVEGLDGIVIGPNDLSYSMDIPNQYERPEFQKKVVDILKRAREKHISAGIHALGEIKQQIEWARRSGMNMLWHSGDIYQFVKGIREDVSLFRSALNNPTDNDKTGVVKIEI